MVDLLAVSLVEQRRTEKQAPHHMLSLCGVRFLVTRGRGFVRIGGPSGETREVSAGDAVLWPAAMEHTLWTEHEPLEAIVIDGPGEREVALR
jgi:mannose-6-phosphate isomerase-like protein (cupin superfamily)